MHTISTTCRLCYNSCGVLVDIQDGIPIKIRGNKAHSLSRGHICRKGLSALEVLNHPQRLKTPLLREENTWKPIEWDEAFDRVAAGLHKLKSDYGAKSVIFARGGSKGMADDYLMRFANLFGSPNVTGASYICYSPCQLASKHTYGFMAYPDLESSPRSVVLWGFNPKVTHPPVDRELSIAKKNGAKVILIDPCPNPSSKEPLYWLKLRPGTDLALALGIIKVILDEQLYDTEFINEWTIGLDRLYDEVKSYTLETIESITWVDSELIRRTARFLCMEKPGCILWGNALEATKDSYQASRAICIIRALTGNLGLPGGDVMKSERGELRRRDPAFLLSDLISSEYRLESLGAQAKLLPDFGYVPHHLMVKAIMESDPYPVRGAYLQNSNMICAAEDAAKTEAALKRLDFLVATDMFMTPTTRFADIVLPSASYLEFDSVEQPWHSPTSFVQQKLASVGEAKSDCAILNGLAKKFNFEQTWKKTEDALDYYLEPAGVSFHEFKNIGEISGSNNYRRHLKAGFPTPSGKVELSSSYLEDLGFDPVPSLGDTLDLCKEYPLVLSSKKSEIYYHSTGRQLTSLRGAQPSPIVLIHPSLAQKYGIEEGDWVTICTSKGSIVHKAKLIAELDPRVVMAEHGWWFPECGEKDGFGNNRSNLNLLTDGEHLINREIGSPCLRGIPCNISKA